MTIKKTSSKSKTKSTERAVMVTTAHRGVFFGYSSDTDGETIKLREGRNILYWSADCKGFMGLAANGPTKGCRVGPAADITIRNITSVTEVSAAAEAAWKAGFWA